jgi:hypothetical protein
MKFRAIKFMATFDYSTRLRTVSMLEPFAALLIEGRLRRHPEGGARRGVLRRRLVTVCPGRLGTPPARHYDLAARSSLHGSGRQMPAVVGRRAPKETEARPRVKNRHGGAPRGERPASWDARRLARRLACRVMACRTGASHAPERFSALRAPHALSS